MGNMSTVNEKTPWILTCEAMQKTADFEKRYEIRVAVKLDDHRQLDEHISRTLKEAGYLFMYSGQAKPIIQYLEEAGFYDQQAIELSQQVNEQQPIAFAVIKLIEEVSQAKTAADYLHIEHILNVEPLDRQIGVLDLKYVPDSLYDVVFAQQLACLNKEGVPELFTTAIDDSQDGTQSTLKTYAIVDASKLEVFDGTHFLDDLPRKSLYTGEAARLYERLAPYIIELEPDHDFTRRLFTQAENEAQEPWYFYQQSAAIIIRSQLDIDALFKHLRKFTRIYNPQTDTWLQYHFYAPYWIEDMLYCMTAAELSKFWGKAIDHIIALKPLKKSVSVISVRQGLSEVKPGKLELTERYEEALKSCKSNRFIQSIQNWCMANIAQHCPVPADKISDYITEKIQLAFSSDLKLEQAILYFVSSHWLMEKEDPTWVAIYYEKLCDSNDSQLLITEKLFDKVLEIKELN